MGFVLFNRFINSQQVYVVKSILMYRGVKELQITGAISLCAADFDEGIWVTLWVKHLLLDQVVIAEPWDRVPQGLLVQQGFASPSLSVAFSLSSE